MARDYKKENKYQSTPEQIANRVKRNAARREMIRKGVVSKGDGKEIDHKTPLIKGGSNDPANLRVRSASANRSFARTKTAGMK